MSKHDESFVGVGRLAATSMGYVRFGIAYGIPRYLKKMKIMAWKAGVDACATNQTKSYRYLSKRDTYPLCGDEAEWSFHALVACGHAKLL
jgi:hypothetical protein